MMFRQIEDLKGASSSLFAPTPPPVFINYHLYPLYDNNNVANLTIGTQKKP